MLPERAEIASHDGHKSALRSYRRCGSGTTRIRRWIGECLAVRWLIFGGDGVTGEMAGTKLKVSAGFVRPSSEPGDVRRLQQHLALDYRGSPWGVRLVSVRYGNKKICAMRTPPSSASCMPSLRYCPAQHVFDSFHSLSSQIT